MNKRKHSFNEFKLVFNLVYHVFPSSFLIDEEIRIFIIRLSLNCY